MLDSLIRRWLWTSDSDDGVCMDAIELSSSRSRFVWIGCTVLAFFVFVWIGDRAAARMMNRLVMSTHFRYAEIYKGELPAGLVILGNSRALHMFHPPAIQEVTQMEVANIGFNALPTVLMPAIWCDYLEHQPSPKKLIFEVTCIGRQDEPGSIARFTTFMPQSTGLSQAIRHFSHREYVASQVSHLYALNSELTWRSLMFARRSDRDWIMTETASDERIERVLELGTEPLIRSPANVDAAMQVLRIADEHQIDVVLVVAPYHPMYRKSLVELPEWIDWLQAQLGRPVLDYSAEMTDKPAFADHLHLNPPGARQLAEMLHQDGLF